MSFALSGTPTLFDASFLFSLLYDVALEHGRRRGENEVKTLDAWYFQIPTDYDKASNVPE